MVTQYCHQFKVDGCTRRIYKDSHGNLRDFRNGFRHVCQGEDIGQEVSMESVFRRIPSTPCLGCGASIYFSSGSFYDDKSGILHTCKQVKQQVEKNQPSFAKERTMNNIKVISVPTRGISANSLSIGEYGRIVGNPNIDQNVGDIVLKAAALVVNLSTPSKVWSSPFDAPQVERLKTGDKIEITVGFTPEFEERVRREANGGANKIMAIKLVREVTNWGLRESKDYVESLLLRF